MNGLVIGTVVGVAVLLTVAACAGIVADRKNRDALGWAVPTLVFAPLILIVLALPPLPARAEPAPPQSSARATVDVFVVAVVVMGALGFLLWIGLA
jgi:hypothetical protein